MPDEPDVPEVPLEPEVPEVPLEPEVPEVPLEPVVPDVPLLTKAFIHKVTGPAISVGLSATRPSI